MVAFNSSLNIFVLFFIHYATKSSISTQATDSSITQLDKTKLKILTQDRNNSTKAAENDSTHYELKEVNNALNYKFNDGVKCVEVKYDNKDVWKHDSSKVNEHPILALLSLKNKTILLVFKEIFTVYEHANNDWKCSFSGKPEGVTLDTKSKKDEDNWSYSKSGNIGTYMAKSGKFINAVKANTNDIWKTDSITEYATKVVVDGIGSKTKLVAIFHVDGKTKGFYKGRNDTKWTEKRLVERKPKTSGESDSGIELDVNKKCAGDGFTASELVGRYTYAAIGENGFSKVKHGETEIWKAEKKEGYAKKVIYFEKKSHGLPDLEIYLPDNKKLEYDKDDQGKWSQRGGSQQTGTGQTNKTSGDGTTPASTT